jgi:hypothetical protein
MKMPRSDAQPTLSDQLLFTKHPFYPLEEQIPRKIKERVTQAHRTSRIFVFDRAASFRVGEICSHQPELIAELQEFARNPFPNTFIEIDAEALIDAFHSAGLKTTALYGVEKDTKLGFLFTDDAIYTVSADGQGKVGWSPLVYNWHRPMTQDQEQRAQEEFGISRVTLDQFLWGNAYEQLDSIHRRSLRLENGLDFMMPVGWANGRLHPMSSLLKGGGAGDLKVALAAILLLIRPNLTITVSTREAYKKLVLGRPTTFLAHRVVTVKLSRPRLISRIKKAAKEDRGRIGTRWHEVRGHYVHSHRAKVSGCVHDWQELEPDKWECPLCAGKRSWRTYPEGKGNAGIGVITKHYEVRAM